MSIAMFLIKLTQFWQREYMCACRLADCTSSFIKCLGVMTVSRKKIVNISTEKKMSILRSLVLASYILLNILVEGSETLENVEKTEIPALFDYKTGLIFYKDETIPACLVEKFSGAGFGFGVLRIPIHSNEDNRTNYLEAIPSTISSAGLLFCQNLPMIKMNVQSFTTVPTVSHRRLKKDKRRVMWGKLRRKRQTYGHYRNVPMAENRGQNNWNLPGQASQAQVQGQVFGTGIFSGQAQTQSGGMSQSQVQLSGVGVRGQIASSSGNAQAQLSLGNGAGSGQAAGLGAGPSNSQVQVTLGQGNEESMASASATSGGATAGVGSGGGPPLSNVGGYYGSTGGGQNFGGSDGSGYRNGNGYVSGSGYLQGSPGSIYRGQQGGQHGGSGQFAQNGKTFPQQTLNYDNFGGAGGSPGHFQSPSGTQKFHESGIGSQTSHNGGQNGVNGHRTIPQGHAGTDFGSGSGSGIRRASNGVRYDTHFGDSSGGRHFDGGPGGNQGIHGVTQPIGPQTNLDATSGLRDRSRVIDFNTPSSGVQNGFRDQSSITSGRGLPASVDTASHNGHRGIPITNDGSRATPAVFSHGLSGQGHGTGHPYAQSSTPGAYATTHGIGQAQAQTAYFGNTGNGQYIPYRYYQDSQPARGRTTIDGVQRYQDQQVGYGTLGQRQQTGGHVPSPTSAQNGYRVSGAGRNGNNGLPPSYTSNGNNGFQYTNGGRSTSHGAGSKLPQSHTSTGGEGGGAIISGPGLGSPAVANGFRADNNLQGTGTQVNTAHGIAGKPQLSPTTGYIPVSSISSHQNVQQHEVASSIGEGRTDYQPHPTSPPISTSSINQQIPGAVRNGQPYRINGLGQVIPVGHSRHPISPTTTTITGSSSGLDVDASHTTVHGQSGFFPSYGVSRVSPDDPEGNKCTIITFSCTIVIESNGRAKICKPNAVKVNNGGIGYNNVGGTGNNGSKICCC